MRHVRGARIRPARLAAAAVGVAVLAGCASGVGDEASGAQPGAAGDASLSGELAIAAAASLTTAFDELAAAFEAQHPGVDVLPVAYDGSSTLATQIVEGAPVDVFASADVVTMQRVEDAGLAHGAATFATNTLTLVVPAGNPGGVAGLADLADPSLTIVLCAPEVPCGAASETLLAAAGVTAEVDGVEQNVSAVLRKVSLGEADAGLVYVTDAASTDAVETIATEGAADVVNAYPIVALDGAANPDAAAAFVDLVRSDVGLAVLARLGFGAP